MNSNNQVTNALAHLANLESKCLPSSTRHKAQNHSARAANFTPSAECNSAARSCASREFGIKVLAEFYSAQSAKSLNARGSFTPSAECNSAAHSCAPLEFEIKVLAEFYSAQSAKSLNARGKFHAVCRVQLGSTLLRISRI